MNSLLIPLIVVSLLLVTLAGIAVWAYMERDTYKNKTDQIVAREVKLAEQKKSDEKDKQFLEDEKKPLKEYKGPAAYGSVSVMYPKTWSAQVSETASSSTPLDGYFHPNYVPGLQSGTAFALRVQVVNSPYDQEAKLLESQVKTSKVKAAAYRAPKVAGDIAGIRFDGEISLNKQGSLILLPLRDKTLKISTENMQFINDFNSIILENLTFVP
jgi:hypothetical protein